MEISENEKDKDKEQKNIENKINSNTFFNDNNNNYIINYENLGKIIIIDTKKEKNESNDFKKEKNKCDNIKKEGILDKEKELKNLCEKYDNKYKGNIIFNNDENIILKKIFLNS